MRTTVTFTRQFLPLLGAIVVLAGCVNDDRSSEPEAVLPVELSLQAVIKQAVDNAIVPSVVAFLADAEALNAAAKDFCSGPDAVKLSAMQNSWQAAFERWFRLSIYNFGPLDDDIVFPVFTFIDSLRLRGTQYIETARSEIAGDIDSSRSLDAAYFGAKTFQRVGLLALESVVFETSTSEHSTAPGDVIADYEFRPRKCEVLQGLSAQLVERARYVEQGWLTAFKGTELPYRTLFLDGQLEDGTEPLTQVLVSAQEFLDYLQLRRVVVTAGQVSMHAWEAISAAIDEVEILLRGNASTTDSIFEAMAATGNQNAVATVEESIAQVRQAISASDIDMLEITLGYLDGNFKREIPDSLEVDLGINFTDGD